MTEEMKKRIDQVYERWTNGLCPGGQVLIRALRLWMKTARSPLLQPAPQPSRQRLKMAGKLRPAR